MKVISIWNPWATLIIRGMKFFETRGWPAPPSIVGQRIGIASTKNVILPQRTAYADPDFQLYYEQSGLPPLEELVNGHLLGTVFLHSVEMVTEDFLEEITREERAFGWFQPGGYAWRLRYPEPLKDPIPIQGKQGVYEWKGFENAKTEETAEVAGEAQERLPARARGQGSGAGQAQIRSYLRVV